MVAVKYLKENAEDEMELTFQRELEILSNFNHPNVIPLVGVCLDKSGPMCLILGKYMLNCRLEHSGHSVAKIF